MNAQILGQVCALAPAAGYQDSLAATAQATVRSGFEHLCEFGLFGGSEGNPLQLSTLLARSVDVLHKGSIKNMQYQTTRVSVKLSRVLDIGILE